MVIIETTNRLGETLYLESLERMPGRWTQNSIAAKRWSFEDAAKLVVTLGNALENRVNMSPAPETPETTTITPVDDPDGAWAHQRELVEVAVRSKHGHHEVRAVDDEGNILRGFVTDILSEGVTIHMIRYDVTALVRWDRCVELEQIATLETLEGLRCPS